jgi:hypothetical protein
VGAWRFVFLDGVIKNTNINRVTYQILLDCFEWQFKRFKILLRDNYKCNDCNIVSDKLHVHHRYYLKDHLPWEIDDSALVALCRDCHYKRHQSEDIKVYIKNGNQLTLTSRNFMFCPRCSGTGYLPQFRHVENGICFLCHGEIPKTIFTKRLKMISNKKQTDEEQLNQLLNFMDSISLDYYSANIHNKIHFSSANNEDNDLPF